MIKAGGASAMHSILMTHLTLMFSLAVFTGKDTLILALLIGDGKY